MFDDAGEVFGDEFFEFGFEFGRIGEERTLWDGDLVVAPGLAAFVVDFCIYHIGVDNSLTFAHLVAYASPEVAGFTCKDFAPTVGTFGRWNVKCFSFAGF